MAAVGSPDGAYAFERALRLENLAIVEYRRILGIFAELVVHDKVPDEKEWISLGSDPAE